MEDWLGIISSEARTGCELTFDFRATLWFDVAALLLLLCAFNELVRRGMRIKLYLPELDGDWLKDPVRKSRDFLKRWRFDQALGAAIGKSTPVLSPEQATYFDADLGITDPTYIKVKSCCPTG